MTNLTELQNLVDRFHANIDFYKDARNAYNEHSCRIEYIDPLLKLLGWDVANEKGLAPQYREVIAENYSTRTDRPDYTITLRGVPKFFVEAKKPAVDITRVAAPAIQTRKYGWNAKHRLAVLTNFEYLAIYDTCHIAHEDDGCAVARYRLYHYTEYVEKVEEIAGLIARDTVYSGDFDSYLDANFPATEGQTQQVDTLFLSQINEWRVALSNELYAQGGRYASLEVLNDVVQEFINQIVFLRICEDKNLPLYHKLKDTITDDTQLQSKLEDELSGAINQVLNYRDKLTKEYYSLCHQSSEPFEVLSPKCVVIIGKMASLTPGQVAAFENFRNSLSNVLILTFDELYQRIVDLIAVLSESPNQQPGIFEPETGNEDLPF